MSSSIADFARDVIARTGGGLLVGAITADDVEGLCRFLVAKYAVADITLPARMSPSISVDDAWHRLLLYPGVYEVACRRAHEMAARIVGEGTGDDPPSSYAYADDYPGLVDHSPNAANDPVPAKEQRRRAAACEMNRLGLIPSTSYTPSAPRSGRSCAIAITPEAPRNVRARLTDGNGLGRDDAEVEAEENKAVKGQVAVEEASEERAGGEDIEEEVADGEEATGNVESTGDGVFKIYVKGLQGRICIYYVNPLMVFDDFVHRVAERENIPHSELYFVYQGRPISQFHNTFAAIGICQHALVHAKPRLRGC
jgi:hypothetical protein